MSAPFGYTGRSGIRSIAPMNAKPFRFFSEKVDECLSLPGAAGLDALRDLIVEAQSDKEAGYGPPQDDLNRARRKWLDRYDAIYVRAGNDNTDEMRKAGHR